MGEPPTLTMSALELAVSMFAARRTFLQQGTIRTTRPALNSIPQRMGLTVKSTLVR